MRKLAKSISTVAQEIYSSGSAPANTTKTHAITALVGSMAAYRAPMPSGDVTSSKEWYIVNCLAGVESMIGQINEHLVLDVNSALRIAKSVWESRYAVVYVPSSKEAAAALMEIVGSGNYRVPPVYGDAIRAGGTVKFQELLVVAESLKNDELDIHGSEA